MKIKLQELIDKRNSLQIRKTEMEEKIKSIQERIDLIANDIYQTDKQISKIEFGNELSLEYICSIENGRLLKYYQIDEIKKSLRENYKIEYGGIGRDGRIIFQISYFVKSNYYPEKIEKLLSIMKPDLFGNKVINIRMLNSDSKYKIINGTSVESTDDCFVKKFSSVKECLDYCYEYIVTMDE